MLFRSREKSSNAAVEAPLAPLPLPLLISGIVSERRRVAERVRPSGEPNGIDDVLCALDDCDCDHAACDDALRERERGDGELKNIVNSSRTGTGGGGGINIASSAAIILSGLLPKNGCPRVLLALSLSDDGSFERVRRCVAGCGGGGGTSGGTSGGSDNDLLPSATDT